MDAVALSCVESCSHSTLRNKGESTSLCPHKFSTCTSCLVIRIAIRCNLSEVKAHIFRTPFLTQHIHKCRLETHILLRVMSVAAALIPDEALCCVRSHRMHHTVVERAGHLEGILLRHHIIIKMLHIYLTCKLLPEKFLAHPCLDSGTSPRHIYDSDRDFKHLLKLSCKHVCSGTCLTDTNRSVLIPCSVALLYRIKSQNTLDIARTDRDRRLGRHYHISRTLDRLTAISLHLHFHIGLTGTYPHLTDKDILKGKFISIVKSEFIWTTCLWCRNSCEPFSISTGSNSNL